MRAAILQNGVFRVGDVPVPDLGPGQVRVRPLANGICGSDLSAWQHSEDFLAANRAAGTDSYDFDPALPLVMGHEFTSVVLETGPGVEDLAPGDVVFTLPWVVDRAGVVRTIGYSNQYPGGMGEEAVVEGAGHVKLPEGVNPYLAATLEPIATGVNGVMRIDVGAGDGAIVTGAGPVGLGSVVELAVRGASPIVVSDPSATRRGLALSYGATVAVDPRVVDPVVVWRERSSPGSRLFVVEASAAQGLLGRLIESCPPHTVFSVVGSQPAPEQLRTMTAVIKNATLVFVTGPARSETRYEALWRALDHLVNERYDPAAMVTGYAGFGGVGAAFAALRPGSGSIDHVKILIRPDITGDRVIPAEEWISGARATDD